MSRVKQINLQIGSGRPTTLEVGDLCASDFAHIERPKKASINAVYKCLNAILDVLQGQEESSNEN